MTYPTLGRTLLFVSETSLESLTKNAYNAFAVYTAKALLQKHFSVAATDKEKDTSMRLCFYLWPEESRKEDQLAS